MTVSANHLADLLAQREHRALQIQTLGGFRVWCDGVELSDKDWGRDKTVQLLQFLVTASDRRALHKEQIIDRLWGEEGDSKAGDQNFKVALHGINKALEPNRKNRAESRFIHRQGLSYQLNLEETWIDARELEQLVALGNQALPTDPHLAQEAYQAVIALYGGTYLPNRLFEDWSSTERERLQVLALGVMINLGEMLLETNPLESIRLAQQALLIDHTWEDAYRIQMKAYLQKGNRPMAIKTFQTCEQVLDEEFGIPPLPETRNLWKAIMKI